MKIYRRGRGCEEEREKRRGARDSWRNVAECKPPKFNKFLVSHGTCAGADPIPRNSSVSLNESYLNLSPHHVCKRHDRKKIGHHCHHGISRKREDNASEPDFVRKPREKGTFSLSRSALACTLAHSRSLKRNASQLAIIENEFGEVGIDDVLVKQRVKLDGSEEQNYCLELNNGCICCSVRTDMAKAVGQMLELHRKGKKVRQFCFVRTIFTLTY